MNNYVAKCVAYCSICGLKKQVNNYNARQYFETILSTPLFLEFF